MRATTARTRARKSTPLLCFLILHCIFSDLYVAALVLPAPRLASFGGFLLPIVEAALLALIKIFSCVVLPLLYFSFSWFFLTSSSSFSSFLRRILSSLRRAA